MDSSLQSVSFSSGASIGLTLEGGVRRVTRGGCDWCFFVCWFSCVSFFPSPPSGARAATQSPRMTFTKLATSVSLASWEVKKGCC